MPMPDIGKLNTVIRKPLFKIFLIGLVLRIVLMPLFGYPYDTMHWALAIQHIQAGAGLYDIDGYYYTPTWGYILGIWSHVFDLFGVTNYGQLFDSTLPLEHAYSNYLATLTTVSFNFIIKIPFLISDIIVGYLIYKIIYEKTNDEKKATLGFTLWFLCPLTIFVSAVHGMFDSISVMFMLLSVYSLRKGRDILAGISMAVAITLKIFPIIAVFALIMYLAAKHKGDSRTIFKRLLTVAVSLSLMTLILFIPQILDGTVMNSLLFFTSRSSSVGGGGGGGWSLSSVVFLLPIIAVVLSPIIAFWLYKKRDADKVAEECFFSSLMLSFAIAVLIPSSPQYALFMIPFLIFFVVIFDKRFMKPFILLSVTLVIYAIMIPHLTLLFSLAAYTNLLDLGHVYSLAEWMNATLFGVPRASILAGIFQAGAIISMILIFWYWVRYRREGSKDV